MADERMPRVDLTKDSPRLSAVDLHYMKKVEAENLERATRLKQMRFRSRIWGSALAATVIAIYSYTIYAVKQETFLDDFEEPEKISDTE